MADLQGLKKGSATLSLIMNEHGGIKDDCIITKDEDNSFFVVLNAGCKDKDLDFLKYHRELVKRKDITISYTEDNSLIAVQGPKA